MKMKNLKPWAHSVGQHCGPRLLAFGLAQRHNAPASSGQPARQSASPMWSSRLRRVGVAWWCGRHDLTSGTSTTGWWGACRASRGRAGLTGLAGRRRGDLKWWLSNISRRHWAVTSSFIIKIECIPICVPGSIFTHKMTNSEIKIIISIYYNVS
jgi:hypothetical protein